MTRLSWIGVGLLGLGAAAIVVASLTTAGSRGGESVGRSEEARAYTFVAFVSEETAQLLADATRDSRITLRFVHTGRDAIPILEGGEVNGIILDRQTAGAVSLDALSRAYAGSRVIAAFNIRPTEVLRGACVDYPDPCVVSHDSALHEDEPAIAWSHRGEDGYRGGETVVHPFSLNRFLDLPALRAEDARTAAAGY